MTKQFLDIVGLTTFKNKLIELFNKRISEKLHITLWNDYWVIISNDDEQE